MTAEEAPSLGVALGFPSPCGLFTGRRESCKGSRRRGQGGNGSEAAFPTAPVPKPVCRSPASPSSSCSRRRCSSNGSNSSRSVFILLTREGSWGWTKDAGWRFCCLPGRTYHPDLGYQYRAALLGEVHFVMFEQIQVLTFLR